MDRLQIAIAILIFSTSGLATYQGLKGSEEPPTKVEVALPEAAPLVQAAALPPPASLPAPLVQAAAPPPASLPRTPQVKPPEVVTPAPPSARPPVKQVRRAKPTTCASLRSRDWRHKPWSWTCMF